MGLSMPLVSCVVFVIGTRIATAHASFLQIGKTVGAGMFAVFASCGGTNSHVVDLRVPRALRLSEALW